MQWTLGDGVVQKHDHADNVLMLIDTGDAMLRDEVFDEVVLLRVRNVGVLADILNDLDALVADLQRDFERFHRLLLLDELTQDGNDVLVATETIGLLGAQEPDVVGRLFHVLFQLERHFVLNVLQNLNMNNLGHINYYESRKE